MFEQNEKNKDPEMWKQELELKERELEIRRREVEIREKELQMKMEKGERVSNAIDNVSTGVSKFWRAVLLLLKWAVVLGVPIFIGLVFAIITYANLHYNYSSIEELMSSIMRNKELRWIAFSIGLCVGIPLASWLKKKLLD